MLDALIFWVMKPLAEIAFVLVIVVVALLIYALASIPGYLKSRHCKHDKVSEDMACNAWCQSCGKNLGFIGTWRERQQKED